MLLDQRQTVYLVYDKNHLHVQVYKVKGPNHAFTVSIECFTKWSNNEMQGYHVSWVLKTEESSHYISLYHTIWFQISVRASHNTN